MVFLSGPTEGSSDVQCPWFSWLLSGSFISVFRFAEGRIDHKVTESSDFIGHGSTAQERFERILYFSDPNGIRPGTEVWSRKRLTSQFNNDRWYIRPATHGWSQAKQTRDLIDFIHTWLAVVLRILNTQHKRNNTILIITRSLFLSRPARVFVCLCVVGWTG